jgi:hypothetical protein
MLETSEIIIDQVKKVENILNNCEMIVNESKIGNFVIYLVEDYWRCELNSIVV